MPPNPRLAGGRVELIGRLRREGARTHPDQATCGVPQTQEPHSGHARRVLTRPLPGSLETLRLDPVESVDLPSVMHGIQHDHWDLPLGLALVLGVGRPEL